MADRRASVLILFTLFTCALPAVGQRREVKPDPASSAIASAKQSVYDFSLVDQDGKVVSLSTYKGKVLLVVNLASQSLYSDQIAALNDLQKTYGPRGFQVIGIPSSDFGDEELKDAAAMRKYYADSAKAEFPVFATAKLSGVDTIPLFQFLCDPKQSVPGGKLSWNFTKFLIDRNGAPLARYEVDVDPSDADFQVIIESALSGKFKKPAGDHDKQPGGNTAPSEN